MPKPMPRPCVCERFRRGQPRRQDECELCWKYWQDLIFHRRHGGTGNFHNGTIVEGAPPQPNPLPCLYLGAYTGERRSCPGCFGRVLIGLRSCGYHGICTEKKAIPEIACCETCPDKQIAPS